MDLSRSNKHPISRKQQNVRASVGTSGREIRLRLPLFFYKPLSSAMKLAHSLPTLAISGRRGGRDTTAN